MSVKIFDGRKDHLLSARYESPSGVCLVFADSLSGWWTFEELDLDMAEMDLSTIKASKSGTDLEVRSKHGERVRIDSSSLRAMIDPSYAAELEKAFVELRGPIEDLEASGTSLPKS